MHVKQGDNVKVIAGNDKGREGEVVKALPKENRVVVEGVNIRQHHEPLTSDGGGIVEAPAPIHASNVKLAE